MVDVLGDGLVSGPRGAPDATLGGGVAEQVGERGDPLVVGVPGPGCRVRGNGAEHVGGEGGEGGVGQGGLDEPLRGILERRDVGEGESEGVG